MPLRILELFSGLGGWRYAFQGLGSVVAAYDISPQANATYALNHGAAPQAKEIASLPEEALLAHPADAWALSPPCQPFCRMGQKLDLEDPRSRAFVRILDLLAKAPPFHLILENVEGFLGSEAHTRLRAVLDRGGWMVREHRLCPTQFGIPNQRPRVYLLASRLPLPGGTDSLLPARSVEMRRLSQYLDPMEDLSLYLDAATFERHRHGMDLVRPEDRRSTCFIGGYGQRYVASGSFLQTEKGVRRFSPTEVARLLGLPETFRFPEDISREKRYKLLGNGLSIPVARWVAAHLPSTT